MEGNGARIIFKSHYVKPKNNASGGTSRYANYIGTREGVVKIAEDQRDKASTNNQEQFIQKIINEVPETKKLQTYFDYEMNKTLGTATDFISEAIDEYGYQVEGVDGYAKYMATRPGVTKVSDTGLFSDGNEPVSLNKISEELKNYRGNVYMPIISLRPEDSIGLGYDNPDTWKKLIEKHKEDFAREYRIPLENFRWVGAYHNAINAENYEHNHIHMIIWSTNPKDGWQSQMTGNNLRSELAKDIFKDELSELYKAKTQMRQDIKDEASKHLSSLLDGFNENPPESSRLVQKEMQELADSLKGVKGRKYYAYLPKDVKQMVDNIMQDIVDSDPKIKELIDTWADTKEKQIRIYSCGEYTMPPLSKVKDFNSIKNKIIDQAVSMNKAEAKLKANEKSIERQEQYQKRAADRAVSSIVRDVERMSKNSQGHTKRFIPSKMIVKDAEDIDAQVRRSQGMK